ncbi:MAG: hypothetical protein PHX68_00795 [Alphaproteobacteria bacterium]|nr:hypothetical protein [Alphaproteobacteria bacterium]
MIQDKLSSDNCFFCDNNKFYQVKKLEEISSKFYETSEIYGNEHGMTSFDDIYGAKIWKTYQEEVIPLIKLAKKIKATAICFTGSSNLPYDAIFKLSNNTLQKIECVTTIDGYLGDLEHEVYKRGEVVLRGPHTGSDGFCKSYGITGTKINRKMRGYNANNEDPEDNMINTERYCVQDMKRIQKKFSKKYKGCWLLVTTDHILAPYENEFLSGIKKSIRNAFNNPFEKIFLCNKDIGKEFIEQIFN